MDEDHQGKKMKKAMEKLLKSVPEIPEKEKSKFLGQVSPQVKKVSSLCKRTINNSKLDSLTDQQKESHKLLEMFLASNFSKKQEEFTSELRLAVAYHLFSGIGTKRTPRVATTETLGSDSTEHLKSPKIPRLAKKAMKGKLTKYKDSQEVLAAIKAVKEETKLLGEDVVAEFLSKFEQPWRVECWGYVMKEAKKQVTAAADELTYFERSVLSFQLYVANSLIKRIKELQQPPKEKKGNSEKAEKKKKEKAEKKSKKKLAAGEEVMEETSQVGDEKKEEPFQEVSSKKKKKKIESADQEMEETPKKKKKLVIADQEMEET